MFLSPKRQLARKEKIAPKQLKICVENNKAKICEEIARLFNPRIAFVYKRLKKLGFSDKKSLPLGRLLKK
ncbi:hypothetical protein [Holospora curviuscula]|uniref:hypothetical protein n=1 Tax=Holospora curviuscula TaxID=1082868 RepID=UPI00101ADB17